MSFPRRDGDRISVLDVIKIVKGVANPRKAWWDLQRSHPEFTDFPVFQFPGERQNNTSVATTGQLIQVVAKLGGPNALQFHNLVRSFLLLGHDEKAAFERALSTHTPSKKIKAGHVYAVTSDIFNAIKVGMWSGTLKGLKSRYAGVYGPTTSILAFNATTDARSSELACMSMLQEWHISHELFLKSERETILQCLSKCVLND